MKRKYNTVGELNLLLKHTKDEAHNQTVEVNRLIADTKNFLKQTKRLVQLKEPVIFLMRGYGDVEIHEGITSSTWVIPERPDKRKKPIEFGETEIARGKKVVYLHPSALKRLKHGTQELRCYFIDEEDAMPIGADPKAWSEMLENIFQAIFVNYRSALEKLKGSQWKGISEIVKYLALGFIGYLIVMWLIGAPPQAPSIPAIPSGVTVIP